MSYANGIITSPPEIADLQRALGDPSTTLRALCTSPNINIWARYKPFRLVKLDDATEAERKAANYGLIFHTANTPGSLVQGVEYNGAVEGGYRIDDLIGYNRNAMPPMSGMGDFSLSELSKSETIFFQQQKGSMFDDLRLSEFPALANFYPCLVIFTRTTGTSRAFICKTAAYTFGEGVNQYIDITYNELSTFANKSLEYMLCGFSAKQTSFDEAQQFGQYISLPAEDALTGLITIRTSVDIEFIFTYITNRIVAGKNTFSPLSTYAGAVSAEGTSARFGVKSQGNIALVARITNNENTTYNMRRKAINVEATETLMTHDPVTGLNPSAMFEITMTGASGTATEVSDSVPLQIRPGETKWVGFNLDAIAYRGLNGNIYYPLPNAQADMDIIFRLGTAFLGGVGQLRIINGDPTHGDIIDPGPIVPDPIL
ncbi:hypothetical protein [uncultured Alistipes sp.]|uniref:hypothetical protein n=1 Tax=uncultured Alistipes sp. TaxID=538949 RepID=UPI00261DA81A|nr:hypothetical protein [uncultured Alistipes sp.]